MTASLPHYLLFSESRVHSSSSGGPESAETAGRWRILLEATDGSSQLEASDEEEGTAERLELLAVVRGLEAIPQPAKVTLITPSRYVNRGLRFGLAEWRENGWQWERFGEMSTVSNADLWQRLDRALRIHQVQSRTWRFDPPHVAEKSARQPARPAARSVPAGAAVGMTNGTRRAIDVLRSWWPRPWSAPSLRAS